MKNHLCLTLAGIIFLTGCAGRDAYPVASYIPGDEKKSCTVLKGEMAQIESEIRKKLPKSDKTGGNVLLGTAGVFLIVPFFFMDLKGADKIELEAFQQRYNALSLIAADKSCEIASPTEAVATDKPTPDNKETNKKKDTAGNLKTCKNCDQQIGNLENVYIFNNNIVCRMCNEKLTKQAKAN